MCSIIRFNEVACGDVGIDLCRNKAFVTEEFLNASDVGTRVE